MSAPSTFGDKLVSAIRDYLKQNQLTKLGQLNAPIIKDIADHLYDHETTVAKSVKKKAKEAEKEAVRARNVMFDALAAACGCNPAEMPKRQATACGVALAEILRIMPDITEAEFDSRAGRYHVLYRDVPCTPGALCAHWGECGAAGGKPHHPKPAVVGAPGGARPPGFAEPQGWREAMREDEDDSDLVARGWATIPVFYQDRIVRKMTRLKQHA